MCVPRARPLYEGSTQRLIAAEHAQTVADLTRDVKPTQPMSRKRGLADRGLARHGPLRGFRLASRPD
jgi:hypothetical protein